MFRRAFTFIELIVVVLILAIVIAILLPALSHVRKAAIVAKMAGEARSAVPAQDAEAIVHAPPTSAPVAPRVLARVTSFVAEVALTPRLSVGTAEPESIYEAKFNAHLQAVRPKGEAGECDIELPLPPEIISLADLTVMVDGESSESVTLRDRKLVWHGNLKTERTPLVVTYTAVGKGVYELAIPPGAILDQFKIALEANGSDVRMLELSLQPTSMVRADGKTVYTWDYKRLMFGQPIRLDVLGIAPIDRLGELSWLGPLSVVVFGLMVGLVAHAWQVNRFDRWMLLLTLGTFAGAYPLMYFAQEFVSLRAAVLTSAAIVIIVVAWRAVTIMGIRLGVLGVVLPAAAIMAVTLISAVQPNLQGILLTAGALGFFIAAMGLIPRIRIAPSPSIPNPTPPGGSAADKQA